LSGIKSKLSVEKGGTNVRWGRSPEQPNRNNEKSEEIGVFRAVFHMKREIRKTVHE
jgi:hypothetical protein